MQEKTHHIDELHTNRKQPDKHLIIDVNSGKVFKHLRVEVNIYGQEHSGQYVCIISD